MSISPMFLLAIDHRNSFERILGGADTRKLIAAKVLVAEAINRVHAELLRPGTTATGAGILLDPVYGTAAVAALDDGVVTAYAIEKSGQEVFDFDRTDWAEHLHAVAPTYAKVLVRYRIDDDDRTRDLQRQRLTQVDKHLASTGIGFLFELLTPLTDAERQHAADTSLDAVRAPLLLGAMEEILDAGIDPDVWKVEGLSEVDNCRAVTNLARKIRDDVGIVVLGAGASPEVVNGWIESGRQGGYSGFAVGRTIWADALGAWNEGTMSDADAVDLVATTYRSLIDGYCGSGG